MRNEQGDVYFGTLERAIRSYQRDHDLAEDGVLLPNGPTVSALKRELFGRAGPTDTAGEDPRAGTRADRATPAPQLARHIDPATTRIHDDHVPNFLQASNPGVRRNERGDARDDARNTMQLRRDDVDSKHPNTLLKEHRRASRLPRLSRCRSWRRY